MHTVLLSQWHPALAWLPVESMVDEHHAAYYDAIIEIEQAIVAALYAAFAAGRGMTSADIRQELANTRPLSVLMAERIDALRTWASERCVPAH